METLHVYIDERCRLCQHLAGWLINQPAYCSIIIYSPAVGRAQHPEIKDKFGNDLTVIHNNRDVYLGNDAWIMCLFMLKDYRQWSYRLSTSLLKPLVSKAYYLIANNRLSLSNLLSTNEEILNKINSQPGGTC